MSFPRKSAKDVNTPRAMTSLDLGKPELDLVEPRRVSRGEIQVNRMSVPESRRPDRSYERKIIRNHVDFFAAGLVDDDVGQEGDELRRRVSRGPYSTSRSRC